MNKKILIILIAVLAILVVGAVFLNPSKQESKIEVVTNGTLHVGSTFQVFLANSNHNPIANQSVSFIVRDSNSNVVVNKSVTTNNFGVADLELDNVSQGQYTVNVIYKGNDKFKNCSVTHTLKVEAGSTEPVSIDTSSSSNSTSNATSNTTGAKTGGNSNNGAFYSSQSEKTYYVGEIDLAPDGHHYKHMGNNEWVRID
ncbi:hypothetical protein [uncultured Methanobrevibacter sp.]|uniref:hypothetical protein n=1 Tax=uncultured Methanobrevibacter sp. TaxID=253161 RepID=UPI0025D1CDD9|nr:hypothetical protein [uncultured Methanobrevibacter sp.]